MESVIALVNAATSSCVVITRLIVRVNRAERWQRAYQPCLVSYGRNA
jgi:predicted transcriptional regulator